MCNNTNLSSKVNFQSAIPSIVPMWEDNAKDRQTLFPCVPLFSWNGTCPLSPFGPWHQILPKSSADHNVDLQKNSKILSTLCLSGVSWFAGRALRCMKSGSRTAANLETLYNPIPPPVIYNKRCVTLWPCHLLFFKR